LRRAFRYAAKQTPPVFPLSLVPTIPLLPVDNVRTGYFERAEIDALLREIPDPGIRDFIEWGVRTGMRKGEIAKLERSMLDLSGSAWVLHLSGGIAKNKRTRPLGLQGEVRFIIERRLAARRLETPLIFHRTAKGKPGQPIYDIHEIWSKALAQAKLPA